MKIGIDARMLGEEQTGIGLYIKNLIENIAKVDDKNQYVLFLRKNNFDYKLPSENFKKVLADCSWYSFCEQTKFLFQIKKEKLDLMHFPHFNAPIFYFKNRITTIHDLTPKYFPGHKMNSFFRKKAFWLVFNASLKFSKNIIAVSEYTKNEIVSFSKKTKDKIHVVYQGIPYRKKDGWLPKEKSEFKREFNIKKPYIFYSGVWRSHKNLVGLVKALFILRKKYKKDICLVLGGKEDKLYPEVRKTWEKLRLSKYIITPGFIDPKDMGDFLKNAEVFVLPSFLEGFGFGPLEALSYQTPCAVSETGALKESLGNAALFFDPQNPEDIAKKVNILLENKKIREKLIQNGKEVLKKYSWEECAKKTQKLYLDSVT